MSHSSGYHLFGGSSSYERRLRGLHKKSEHLKSENEDFVALATHLGFPVVSAYETLTTSIGVYGTMV
jgi:hypothetical protein